jgi:hypothetical protein
MPAPAGHAVSLAPFATPQAAPSPAGRPEPRRPPRAPMLPGPKGPLAPGRGTGTDRGDDVRFPARHGRGSPCRKPRHPGTVAFTRKPRHPGGHPHSRGNPGTAAANHRSRECARSARAPETKGPRQRRPQMINVRPRAASRAAYPVTGFAGSCRLFIVWAFVTMSCVRCTKVFTATIGEICVTVARPSTRRRGGGNAR